MQKIFRHHLLFKIMCVVCFFDAIFFVLVGLFRTGEGVYKLYKSVVGSELLYPGAQLAESLDSFMMALLFMIFGFGIYRLFIKYDEDDANFPRWLNVKSISDLKFLLWETILVTLIVFSVLRLVSAQSFTVNELIPSGIVLVLSLFYFLVSKGKKH